ncbi:MAG TPA: AraC family transcriptional regulator [Chitinophaga sp.]|uniref:AraC family transcriptional regulator n=1 Tax=Chitinophaga sp. TaxID=1869181 RepID=UPI002C9630F7|nr:AraC family transcriptional regulator [Chitinophaga sp.]HVI47060.1 AraC family transcriptional regulator [Chitinophaga sp.]
MDDKGYISYRISVPVIFESLFTHFYVAANNTGEDIRKTFVPSFQTIMVFSFGKEVSFHTADHHAVAVDKCIVLGPVRQPFSYTLTPGAEIFVANFRGDGFYRFFGQALVEGDLPVLPDDLIHDNCFTALWHTLKSVHNTEDRVTCLLEFSRPYIRQQDDVAGAILSAAADPTKDIIKSTAALTGETARNIQLKQKKYFGYSAKEKARFQRFLKAIELIQQLAAGNTRTDWFEVVDQCGYYDQSQLIRDFRHFLNLTPGAFLQFQQDICLTTL